MSKEARYMVAEMKFTLDELKALRQGLILEENRVEERYLKDSYIRENRLSLLYELDDRLTDEIIKIKRELNAWEV